MENNNQIKWMKYKLKDRNTYFYGYYKDIKLFYIDKLLNLYRIENPYFPGMFIYNYKNIKNAKIGAKRFLKGWLKSIMKNEKESIRYGYLESYARREKEKTQPRLDENNFHQRRIG